MGRSSWGVGGLIGRPRRASARSVAAGPCRSYCAGTRPGKRRSESPGAACRRKAAPGMRAGAPALRPAPPSAQRTRRAPRPSGGRAAGRPPLPPPSGRPQGPLDLDRVDVLAARLDEVLRPVDEAKAARGILDEHVAHVEPAAAEFAGVDLGGAPVAAEERGA